MRRGRHPQWPGFLAEMDDESSTQPNVWEDEAAPVKERVKNLAHIRNLCAQRWRREDPGFKELQSKFKPSWAKEQALPPKEQKEES